ncbi:hypothetical protein BVC80_165g18 [Macleaya cordata]|uniref:Uncharacterized protein n=1 Tax=Macleaya cordata TaxID=56857 RepID=A0A200Q918_MACCD|nr:hypothetical protein BVC80_165g18 [Macleaya cordata]
MYSSRSTLMQKTTCPSSWNSEMLAFLVEVVGANPTNVLFFNYIEWKDPPLGLGSPRAVFSSDCLSRILAGSARFYPAQGFASLKIVLPTKKKKKINCDVKLLKRCQSNHSEQWSSSTTIIPVVFIEPWL